MGEDITEEVETPMKVANAGTVERHRLAFNMKVFPALFEGRQMKELKDQPPTDSMSFDMSQQEWEEAVNIVLNFGPKYERDATQEQLAFRKKLKTTDMKKFRRWFNIIDKYKVVPYSLPGSTVERNRLLRLHKRNGWSEGQWLMCVPQLEVFDAISECHGVVSHMKMNTTCVKVHEKYYNITEEKVNTFVEMCEACNSAKPTIKKQKGAKKPIISENFRDRFQVDLIDMRGCEMPNVYGVIMRWILSLKDHSTQLTYLAALPRKKASFVAHELDHVFGLIGYPSIFHTDNGKEFTAQEILVLLKEYNEAIITVTGRPRKPSDQGSIESMNKLVEKIIRDLEAEERLKGNKVPNWTRLLGRAMQTINSKCGRGKFDCEPYKAVFGQSYNEQIQCPVTEMRKCSTIEERLRLCSDERLEKVAEGLYHLDGSTSPQPPSDPYWEDDGTEETSEGVLAQSRSKSTSADENRSLQEMAIATAKEANSHRSVNHSETETDATSEHIHQGKSASLDLKTCGKDEEVDQDSSASDLIKEMNDTKTRCKSPIVADEGIEKAGDEDDGLTASVTEMREPQCSSDLGQYCVEVGKTDGRSHLSSSNNSGSSKQPSEETSNMTSLGSNETTKKRWKRCYRKKYSFEEAKQLDKKRCLQLPSRPNGRKLKSYDFLFPTLLCDCCPQGSALISVGDNKYFDDCENTNRWLESDFLSSFGTLAAHFSHGNNTIITRRFIPCNYPNDEVDESQCYSFSPAPTSLVSVFYGNSHFVVAEMDIPNKVCTISDGLRYPLSTWKDHIINVLRRCNLVDIDCIATFDRKSNILEFDHYLISKKWTVRYDAELERQRDSYNCGPIACLKLNQIFCCKDTFEDLDVSSYRSFVRRRFEYLLQKFSSDLSVSHRVREGEESSKELSISSSTQIDCFCFENSAADELIIRLPCCNKRQHANCAYKWLQISGRCSHCREEVKEIEFQGAKIPIGNVEGIIDSHYDKAERNDFILSKQISTPLKCKAYSTLPPSDARLKDGTPLDEEKTPLREADRQRGIAAGMKRKRQKIQAQKMIDYRDSQDNGVGVGAIVTVALDSRDVTHAAGIRAVVYNVKENTGGILACCESGVVVQGQTKCDYWIPIERYRVTCRPDEFGTSTDKLSEIRRQVLDKSFSPSTRPRVTLTEAHKYETGRSPKRRRACKCKDGKYTGRCGCVSNNLLCSSSCSCGGNCSNQKA